MTSGSSKWPATLVAMGSAVLAVGVVLLVRPASTWLRALTPDGQLEPQTAAFLDAMSGIVLLGGVLLLGLGVAPRLRNAVADGWRQGPPPDSASGRWIPPAAAILAFALRLVVARQSDIGLGDDGARVAWLQSWVQHPGMVWSGMWLPAHLYLHALIFAIVRDAVWAGIALSALAAGGTAWILTHSVTRTWGGHAGVVTALTVSCLPVSLAYGSNPDVNPVFAFFVVASMASVSRGARKSSWAWVLLGWFCLAIATWMRFDSLLLVPAIGLLLWPRLRAILVFVVSASLPLLVWNFVDSLVSHRAGHVVSTIRSDPTLQGSLISNAFSYSGAIWQAVTLPVLVLGLIGMARAMNAKRGRNWILLPLVHAVSLAGTTIVLQAGTQSRYFILIGSVFAAYAGVGLAGMFERSRLVGAATALLAIGLFVYTPSLYPGGNTLWARRDPQMRALVDHVARLSEGRDIVWVGDSAYFYFCRKRPPLEQYHALSRADSDPGVVVAGLDHSNRALACVENNEVFLERWRSLLDKLEPMWRVERIDERGEFMIYGLRRQE